MIDPSELAHRQAEAVRLHEESVTSGEHMLVNLPMRDVESTAQRLVVEMDNRPDLTNVRGALQGGLLATLIDIAAGRLAMSAAPGGCATATADLHVRYLAPIVIGPARADAKLVRAGRRSIVVHTDVHDVGTDRLAATATLSFAVLEPR